MRGRLTSERVFGYDGYSGGIGLRLHDRLSMFEHHVIDSHLFRSDRPYESPEVELEQGDMHVFFEHSSVTHMGVMPSVRGNSGDVLLAACGVAPHKAREISAFVSDATDSSERGIGVYCANNAIFGSGPGFMLSLDIASSRFFMSRATPDQRPFIRVFRNGEMDYGQDLDFHQNVHKTVFFRRSPYANVLHLGKEPHLFGQEERQASHRLDQELHFFFWQYTKGDINREQLNEKIKESAIKLRIVNTQFVDKYIEGLSQKRLNVTKLKTGLDFVNKAYVKYLKGFYTKVEFETIKANAAQKYAPATWDAFSRQIDTEVSLESTSEFAKVLGELNRRFGKSIDARYSVYRPAFRYAGRTAKEALELEVEIILDLLEVHNPQFREQLKERVLFKGKPLSQFEEVFREDIKNLSARQISVQLRNHLRRDRYDQRVGRMDRTTFDQKVDAKINEILEGSELGLKAEDLTNLAAAKELFYEALYPQQTTLQLLGFKESYLKREQRWFKEKVAALTEQYGANTEAFKYLLLEHTQRILGLHNPELESLLLKRIPKELYQEIFENPEKSAVEYFESCKAIAARVLPYEVDGELSVGAEVAQLAGQLRGLNTQLADENLPEVEKSKLQAQHEAKETQLAGLLDTAFQQLNPQEQAKLKGVLTARMGTKVFNGVEQKRAASCQGMLVTGVTLTEASRQLSGGNAQTPQASPRLTRQPSL